MARAAQEDVVITGVGMASPIGIGREAFWDALRNGRSGVRSIERFVGTSYPAPFGAEVLGFDGKQFITPRKSMKVMSREIQTAFAAARLACQDAGLEPPLTDPERCGVVIGCDMLYTGTEELVEVYRACIRDGTFDFSHWGQEGLPQFFPLWLLKYLPNMPACHVGIALDARGPTNSIVLGEVSSLIAIAEGFRLIERGAADVVLVGGTGSRLAPASLAFRDVRPFSQCADYPETASRPFDADRDGQVNGEGAGMIMLESRRHAESRRAKILAQVLSTANTCEPRREGLPSEGWGIRTSIELALSSAGIRSNEIGHVNAHGLSDRAHDALEAQAIQAILGDVPVTAPKSYFGNLGAGSGAIEFIVSVLSLDYGEIPITLNYERPDPECPINVVHGKPMALGNRVALVLNQASYGQALAAVIASN